MLHSSKNVILSHVTRDKSVLIPLNPINWLGNRALTYGFTHRTTFKQSKYTFCPVFLALNTSQFISPYGLAFCIYKYSREKNGFSLQMSYYVWLYTLWACARESTFLVDYWMDLYLFVSHQSHHIIFKCYFDIFVMTSM